jgi:hypothetical protein
MCFPPKIQLFLVLLISPLCWCQQPSSDLTARTLWLEEQPDSDKLPTIPAAKAHQVKKVSLTVGGAAKPTPEAGTALGTTKNEGAQPGTVIPSVKNLGLRYNLLLVDAQSGQGEPVESERVFQPGECVALELEANHSGYLYVLNRGSSGSWQPLLPSPEMADEANIIGARSRVRVPQNYCFKIEGPAGEEQMFVVLSRNPAELYGLHDSIKNDDGGGGAAESGAESTGAGSSVAAARPVSSTRPGPPVMTAQLRLSHEVSRMEASLGMRDLKITKIAQSQDAAEPPGSVYVVNSSAASSDKVVTEIRIRHK